MNVLETIHLPCAPTAGEERSAVVALILQDAADPGEPSSPRDRLQRLAQRVAAGEHVRDILPRTDLPKTYDDTLAVLVGEHRAALAQIPEQALAAGGLLLVVDRAALVAARFVAGLDAASFAKLHQLCSYPIPWTREHAIGGLVACLVKVWTDDEMARRSAGKKGSR